MDASVLTLACFLSLAIFLAHHPSDARLTRDDATWRVSASCNCVKACNNKHKHCFDVDTCITCVLNETAPPPFYQSQPPTFALDLSMVHKEKSTKKCSCAKTCNTNNKLCYEQAACFSCLAAMAPSPQATVNRLQEKKKSCSCRKSCNPKDDGCFDKASCRSCILGSQMF